jgi:glycerophosphoryl diester phosphodiesterase
LDAGHSVLVPEFSLITGQLNTDLDIFPWTVNDVAIAEELVERGVTGIITNDPGTISATLRRES